jgi:hypothetical protein
LPGVGWSVEAQAEFDHPECKPDHFAEEEGLGHGGGLEVEQIGIEGKEGERDDGGRGREPKAGEAIDSDTG